MAGADVMVHLLDDGLKECLVVGGDLIGFVPIVVITEGVVV